MSPRKVTTMQSPAVQAVLARRQGAAQELAVPPEHLLKAHQIIGQIQQLQSDIMKLLEFLELARETAKMRILLDAGEKNPDDWKFEATGEGEDAVPVLRRYSKV